MTQMDTDESHEDLTGMDRIEYRLTMKCMKMHEGKPGNAALRSGFNSISPLATNVSPLKRPAAANKGKQCFVCMGNPDSSGFPLATLLRNFSHFSMSRPATVSHSVELETSIGRDMEKSNMGFFHGSGSLNLEFRMNFELKF